MWKWCFNSKREYSVRWFKIKIKKNTTNWGNRSHYRYFCGEIEQSDNGIQKNMRVIYKFNSNKWKESKQGRHVEMQQEKKSHLSSPLKVYLWGGSLLLTGKSVNMVDLVSQEKVHHELLWLILACEQLTAVPCSGQGSCDRAGPVCSYVDSYFLMTEPQLNVTSSRMQISPFCPRIIRKSQKTDYNDGEKHLYTSPDLEMIRIKMESGRNIDSTVSHSQSAISKIYVFINCPNTFRLLWVVCCFNKETLFLVSLSC